MTVDQILAVLAQARSGSGRLLLEEYMSQDGKIATHELRLGGPDLYLSLIRDTVTWLKGCLSGDTNEHVIAFSDLATLAPLAAVDTALRAALDNMETKLGTPPEAVESKQASVQGDPNLFDGASGPQLRNVVSLRCEIIRPASLLPGKPRAPKPEDPVATVKKAMAKVWPLASYGVSFTLVPGRFKSLTALP